MRKRFFILSFFAAIAIILSVLPQVGPVVRLAEAKSPAGPILSVGPGQRFERLEDALEAAGPGSTILVFPLPNGQPYRQVRLLVRTPNLTICSANPKKPVVLDGAGFNYSGQGSVPRAIVQFDPTATGGRLEGFTLQNASNDSHNGAGVRINQANDVVISRCTIRKNDMGLMSNGSALGKTGANQLIENCLIERNGSLDDPGYNHNLYQGGYSVTIRHCEIAWSLTGHNVKSRAHKNLIVDCFIHDSANRELDLVDAKDGTDAPDSDAIIKNCRIAKNPQCEGNRGCIHFGHDGGAPHNGTITLENNTIATPFIAPVLDVSDARGIVLKANKISDGGSNARGVVVNRRGPRPIETKLSGNKVPERFVLTAP